MPATELDFAAFRAAFEGKDRERWLSFYADDAEWIEYRHFSPPRAPNRMVGSAAIGSHLAEVCASDLALVLGDEVLSAERVAFSVECRFETGGACSST